jgi:beta-glucosidase
MKKRFILPLLCLCAVVYAEKFQGWKEATTPTEETATQTWRKFWQPRFKQKLALAQKLGKHVDVVLCGDSITHNWDGNAHFKETFKGHTALNLGFGGDRTEHTLWIINHQELWKNLDPKLVVLMIGTNNTPRYSVEATVEGIRLCVESLKKQAPNAKIVLFAIFPRGVPNNPLRVKLNKINAEIAKFADGERVFFENINSRLMDSEGKIDKTMRPDLLHPVTAGYVVWADALKKYLTEIK